MGRYFAVCLLSLTCCPSVWATGAVERVSGWQGTGKPTSPYLNHYKAGLIKLMQLAVERVKSTPLFLNDGEGEFVYVPQCPVLPPIEKGEKLTCAESPDLAEVLRALPRLKWDRPFYSVYRTDLEFTAEKIADHIDPPRFFPLIGPAQLHHCHWKCTVHFREVAESQLPIFPLLRQRKTTVVYIDKDHLHLIPQVQSD